MITMSIRDRERWEEKYAVCQRRSSIRPDDWLVETLRAIETTSSTPKSPATALDIACGLGHNAIWLSQQGWSVDAVDISATGLELAKISAAESNEEPNWIEADLDQWQPRADSYDLVVVFRFLDRTSVPRIVRTGLRPGGWLVYETFSQTELQRTGGHISNPLFTLAPGELAELFSDFDVFQYGEEKLHDRSVVQFLARRQIR
jgi:2-polyprenyl-3-methyl-5-hydroxy-6-metoxy-1,4-benzoquinol methylase